MKYYSILLLFIFTDFFFSQNTEISQFNLAEYKKLIKKSCYSDCEVKTYGNQNFIQFKRNDSTISMSYQKNHISSIIKTIDNYYIVYEFHPNLNIKSRVENIGGVSQMLQTPIGIETRFDMNGKIIEQIDYDNIPYDENIPTPKKKYHDIILAVKKDFNFDVFKDKSLFGIHSFYDEKTKKVNYKVIKFLGDENNILKLLIFEYDGETGNFVKQEKSEMQLPDGGLPHY
ncbi:hypothetical protein [Chryseobacterium jejuense]|uniref:Uncharacterized protein n=1 Tax=Chryseobacterium jejuense TaxID=445960 RepID=A0A2X2XDQ8_CHRJE|nr:hypothetical protein [Chryseobacterium jejuense]SDJ57050.1 hypothetical protein SAMN05421542_3841 [Chryseobacterium jejuense]SQB46165.1 Uncharacterised protein [Chryseobacterium jejuense]